MLRSSHAMRALLLLATMLSGMSFAMCALSASPTSKPPAANIDQIEQMIRKNGAQATVRTLYHHEGAWDHLRKHIAKGDPRWLKAGAALYSAADGGARQMLAHSLGEALNPAAALELTLASQQILNVTDVCVGPDIDDDRFSTYETAVNALHQTVASVQRVSAPELQSYKDECLRQLVRQESSISTFFGHAQ
jgi:hypothetical protein